MRSRYSRALNGPEFGNPPLPIPPVVERAPQVPLENSPSRVGTIKRGDQHSGASSFLCRHLSKLLSQGFLRIIGLANIEGVLPAPSR